MVLDRIPTTLPLITNAFRNLIRFFASNQRYTHNGEGKAFDGTTSHLWMSHAVFICSGSSATALRCSGQADFSREEEGGSERASGAAEADAAVGAISPQSPPGAQVGEISVRPPRHCSMPTPR